MIHLDFEINESTLAEDASMKPAIANPAALQETYFEMPVRFQIGGVELLQIPQGDEVFLELPLVDVATSGLKCVKNLESEKIAIYHLPGGWNLNFKREENTVTIESSVNGRFAKTGYAELVGAFEFFSEKVRSVLLAKIPELSMHPDWGHWFSNEATHSEPEASSPTAPQPPITGNEGKKAKFGKRNTKGEAQRIRNKSQPR
nr:hypothetical protein [Oscillatoria laete-virens]